jgi:transposase
MEIKEISSRVHYSYNVVYQFLEKHRKSGELDYQSGKNAGSSIPDHIIRLVTSKSMLKEWAVLSTRAKVSKIEAEYGFKMS